MSEEIEEIKDVLFEIEGCAEEITDMCRRLRVKLKKYMGEKVNEEMSSENWQKIHDFHNTDLIGMITDYKHERITASQLHEIISSYCEMSYKTGKRKKQSLPVSNQ